MSIARGTKAYGPRGPARSERQRARTRPAAAAERSEVLIGTAFGLALSAMVSPGDHQHDVELLTSHRPDGARQELVALMTDLPTDDPADDRFLSVMLGMSRLVDLRHDYISDVLRAWATNLDLNPQTLVTAASAVEKEELRRLLANASVSIIPTLSACGSVRSNVFEFSQPKGQSVCLASLDMLADRTMVELKATMARNQASRLSLLKP